MIKLIAKAIAVKNLQKKNQDYNNYDNDNKLKKNHQS
jgi:hypothetical protein